MKKIFTLIAVAFVACALHANELTVADGQNTTTIVPFFGSMMGSQETISQMIYPAEMLSGMQGGAITKVKFYPNAAFTGLGSGNLKLAFKVVDQDGFQTNLLVTGTVAVANGYPVNGETELVFTLDQPYVYTGGNLLIETELTQHGSSKSTQFLGLQMDNKVSLVRYMSASYYSFSTSKVLPKATFTYNPAPTAADYCLSPIASHQFTGYEQATVTITNREPGATVYYEIKRFDNILSDEELVSSGSFTGEQYDLNITGADNYSVYAHAVKAGKLDSPDCSVTFTIEGVEEPVERCTAPYVDYAVTGYDNVTVTIANNESGARVYFEIYQGGNKIDDGSFTGSSYSLSLNGGGDYQVRAYAVKSGKDDSTVAGVFFTIVEEVAPLERCAAPYINHAVTGYETATVTITNNESSARVYFEIYQGGNMIDDGSFTGSSYSLSLTGSGDYQVGAYAVKSGMDNSTTAGVLFTIVEAGTQQCAAPDLDYAVTGYDNVTVTIANNESGARVYFEIYQGGNKIDQGSFTGSSYSLSLNGGGDYQVRAYAVKTGKDNSTVAGVFFTIVEEVAPLEQCAAPYAAHYVTGTENVTVVITNNESGARVYYEVYQGGNKIDQGSFTGSSYSLSLTGGGDYVVRTYAVKSGMDNSPVAGVLFTIVEEEAPAEKPLSPIITYQFTGPETVMVTVTNREENATVYYWYDIDNDGYHTFTGDTESFMLTGAGRYTVGAAAAKDDAYSSLTSVCFTILSGQSAGMRGDVNGDGFVNITDVTALINYLLTDSGNVVSPDVSLDGQVNITDVTVLINYLLTDSFE
ncbi:MAG: hypothetical protein IKX56_07850 [Muribaculaceae bacterium]|nr:hypothetical protein [Muribaculaceae bacterium]